MNITKKIRLAGLLILISIAAGVFSIAPAIDSTDYLTRSANHSNRITTAALFQFIMSLAYLGFAILLYPIIQKFGRTLSIGFLSLRIIAVSLSILGTLFLLSILTLSDEFVKNSAQYTSVNETLGSVLKIFRDYINHVFMVLVLCTGNLLLYILLIKSNLIPKWLSVWGIIGSFLSAAASILVVFRFVEIISFEYLSLNASTGIQELVLGLWLVAKGFNKKAGSDGILEQRVCKVALHNG